MQILLIHQAFATPNQAGGTRHIELARAYVARGNEFTVVASDLGYLTGQRIIAESKSKVENIDGVRILRASTLPMLHRSFLWRVVAFSCFMMSSLWTALSAGPVDVVIGTTPPIFQTVSAWLVALIRRRPFLLEVRDLWPSFAIDMGVLKNPVLISMSRWLEHFLYTHANHLLVNSPAYVEYLQSQGVPVNKISLIANGVDPKMFDPDAQGLTIRQKFGLVDKFVVTYAGALGVANDIPTLLRAAESVRDFRDIQFLLVGDGKERANLETLARQMNLTNIRFTGTFPKSEMRDVLAASDACVAILQDIPMFRTTYPNKVFDYMAAGRPTILAIDGVIRQVILDSHGGVFVPPGNARALADAVLRLYREPERAQAMGKSARAYVVEHFNRADQARDFAELMERLAQVT